MEKKVSDFVSEYQPQLIEIRKVVFRSLGSFVVGGVVGLIFNRKIILFLISLFDLTRINIVLTSPYQFVNLAIGVAVTTGLITTLPVFVFYLLKFIRPALKETEYVLIKKLIPVSVVLFVGGCLFGARIEQFVVSLYAKTTLDYSLSNFWDIEVFLSQMLVMSVTMGLVFQLPIVLTILIRLKVVTKEWLKIQRPYVYTALTLFGVVLPPTDVISLLMIITPLFLLYEGTLILNRNI